MRAISLIVVHCSATREDKSFTEHDLDVCHRRRGFNGVGYHFYIRKNGDIKSTRPLERIGAHARGFNSERCLRNLNQQDKPFFTLVVKKTPRSTSTKSFACESQFFHAVFLKKRDVFLIISH